MMQVSSSGAMRPLGRLFGVLFGLGAVLMLLFAMPLAGRADAAKKPPRVTIRTTQYGIPRILADNPYGLGYGYGWAIASEQLCTLADTYTTVRASGRSTSAATSTPRMALRTSTRISSGSG